jgi:hypothetical protein
MTSWPGLHVLRRKARSAITISTYQTKPDAMTIYLKDILPISNPTDYKVHFARWNGMEQPLEAWTRNREEWLGWQEYRPGRNDFNRKFIFSLMQFYHEVDSWLFGGMFRVLADRGDSYEVELSPEGANFVGRLKLRLEYRDRKTRVNFENHYPLFEVQEILREPYSGQRFPGYENIDLSFDELETIIRNERTDWKTALQSIKGVYLITDRSSGGRYVGAAYGDVGVWSRWCSYVATSHGGNAGLLALLDQLPVPVKPEEGEEGLGPPGDARIGYCRANFRFSLLEHLPITRNSV